MSSNITSLSKGLRVDSVDLKNKKLVRISFAKVLELNTWQGGICGAAGCPEQMEICGPAEYVHSCSW